jgi:hypothetical protein
MSPTGFVLVYMFLNGTPTNHVLRLDATSINCRTELATLQGINKAQKEMGRNVEFDAICIPPSRS